MAKLKEIAEDVGCSMSLVSKVLSPFPPSELRITEERRKQIIESAKRLGFRRNRNAEFLRTGKNASIGLFLPSTPDTLLANLVMGLSREAEVQGFPLNLFFGLEVGKFNYFINSVKDFSNSGIITYMYQNAFKESEIIEKYYNDGGNVVMLNPHVDIGSIPKVYMDNYHGGRIAAEHLIKRGCRNFLACTRYAKRTEGFLDTVKSAAFKDIETFDIENNIENYFEDYFGKNDITGKFPLGVFCTSDLSALRVMKAVRKTSFRIGRDILIIGYDNQYLTEEFDPPLTSLDQPFYDEGILAVKMLIKMLYGDRQGVKSEKLLPELIERGSA